MGFGIVFVNFVYGNYLKDWVFYSIVDLDAVPCEPTLEDVMNELRKIEFDRAHLLKQKQDIAELTAALDQKAQCLREKSAELLYMSMSTHTDELNSELRTQAEVAVTNTRVTLNQI